MIKKLRRKFILINMTLVASILAVVLSIFYYSNFKRLEGQTDMMMIQAMERDRFGGKPNKVEPGRRDRNNENAPPFLPIAVVLLAEDGTTVKELDSDHLSISDDLAATLTSLVLSSGSDRGVLKDYSLRYLTIRTPSGQKIAFADQNFEISTLKSLLRNCLLIFFIASFLFFLLSLYLSYWALRPVEMAWKQQNQFIADASHELKTPLTVILANLQILLSHRDSSIKSQQKWVDNTKEEAASMKRLVEELLFLARSDAGTADLTSAEFSEFDYSDAVLNCVLLFESVAFENKVQLDQDVTPDIHLTGNEPRLKQMITILLDNACKYAGKNGSVFVRLTRTSHHAVLSLKNSGEPIPSDEQRHIFERFYRTDKSRVRAEGGYGLGLSIAKTIVDQHKGKITVTSSAEDGTVFTVSLPA